MNIENHKKTKPQHKGKDVKANYDLKRDRERMAAESVRMNVRRDASAPTPAPRGATKRPRRMAAE
jgi:hypothetical protein